MPAQLAKNYPLSVVSASTSTLDKTSEIARQDSPAVCPSCYGTGMEVITGKGARRCPCRIEDQQAKLLSAANIPRRYERCSFTN